MREQARRARRGMTAATAGACGLLLVLLAMEAGAVEDVITFQELEPGTPVTGQYESRGVRFGVSGGALAVPRVVALGTPGNRAAEFGGCAGRTCVHSTTASFTDPTGRIRLAIASGDETQDGVVLAGLDAEGAEIATTRGVASPGTFSTVLTLTAPAGRPFTGFTLRAAVSSTSPRKITFDDLSFDRPDAPPPAPSPPPPPPPAPADDPGAGVSGPEALKLGDPARFVAAVEPDAARYEWDLGADGTYERDTAADPSLIVTFANAGPQRVALRATLPDGRVLHASHDVAVQRPPLLGVGFQPANPEPGDQVSFGVASAREKGTALRLFTWDFAGLRPADEEIRLGGGRASAAAAGGPTAAQTVELDGAQPTRGPRLRRGLPRKGSLPYVVKALDDAGHLSTVHGNIGVGDGGPPGPLVEQAEIVDCDKPQFEGPCAAISVYGQPATKVKTIISDATPSMKVCLPSNVTIDSAKNRALAKYQAKVDLGYPAPEQFGANQSFGQQQAAGRSAEPPVAHSALRIDKKCRTAAPQVLSWNLGDGTTYSGASVPSIVSHEYGAAKTYKVTLIVRVPYITNSFAFVFNDAPAAYFTARKTIEVTVVEAYCGTLKLNGVPTRAMLLPSKDAVDVGANGCFLPQEAADGEGTVYRPFPGYGVDLNTIGITSSHGVPVIDPDHARVSPPPGGNLTGRLGTREVFRGAQIDVPKPTVQNGVKELGGAAAAPLPPFTGPASAINGLLVVRTQAFLSTSRAATVVAWLKLPEPLKGDPTAVFGGGPAANLSSTAEDDEKTDFEIDLSGTDLGFVKVEELIIKHRVSGGWLGGGKLTFPAPLNMTLDAPYLREKPGAKTSPKCYRPNDDPSVDAPSGLSIDQNGDFEFGGAALVFKPALNLYFLELSCVSVAASSRPGAFYLVGKLAMGIPAGSPVIGLDGCVLYARLDKGEGVGEPKCESPKGFTAPQDITWVRGLVGINLYDQLDLAKAFVDIRSDSCSAGDAGCKPYQRYGFGGEIKLGDVGYDDEGELEGDLGLIAKVDGVIYDKPKFMWQVFGKGGGCVPVFCLEISAAASSIGVGACAGDEGYLKYYFATEDIDWGLFSCDLEDLLFEKPGSRRAGLRSASGAPLGGTMAQDVKLPGGMPRVGFRVAGVGAEAPRVTITGPGGTRIVDTGAPWRKESGFHIGRKDNATWVQVDRPKGGTWRIAAQPGSPAFQEVEVARPIDDPRVLATVRGRGASRAIRYRVDVARGDTVTFVEEGATVARPLGAGRDGRGTLRFRTGAGSPGQRTVAAVVERNGFPIRRFVLDRYTVKRPALGRPGRLRAVRSKRGLAVSWRRARGARGYRLVAALRGGRRVEVETKGTRTRLAGVSPTEPVRLSLVALGQFTRQSAPVKSKLRQKRPRPVKLSL